MSPNDDLSRAGRNRQDNENSKLNFKVGKNYLLIIGIDKYSGGIPKLRNAVSDAKTLKQVLVERYQFEDGEPFTLELYDENATRKNIIRVFDKLILGLKEEDSLVFYFSGHGEYIEYLKKGYWIPVDAVNEDRSTYLPNDEVFSLIGNLKARHVFGIVDSCFSGSLFRSVDKNKVTQRYFSKPSRIIMTSGQLEPVADGSLGGQSPFNQKLVSQLKSNIDNSLRVGVLCENILNDFEFDDSKQVPQWGPLMNVGHSDGQFILFQKDGDWTAVVEQEQQQISTPNQPARSLDSTPSVPTPPVVYNSAVAGSLDLFKADLELKITMDLIPEAFEMLYKQLTNNQYRTTILVRYGEFNSNKKKEENGTADAKDLKTSYAQIRSAFLSVVGKLTERDLKSL